MQTALASGVLRPVDGGPAAAIEQPADAPPDTPALLARTRGRCVCYQDAIGDAGGHCRIQAALGHDALPLACRQFPRVSLIDPRGVSVTLSHYCPTAAALLETPGPAEILVNGAGFPAHGEYVGLDVRTALPPALRRDMLMDWDAWWECERLAVAGLSSADAGQPRAALAGIRTAVADIQRWSPGDGPLIDRVREAFDRAVSRPQPDAPAAPSALTEAVFAAIPDDIRPARLDHPGTITDAVLGRYLAAHAFANWTAHLGAALHVWARSIDAAAALIDAGAGVRQTDLLLRHLADPAALARQLDA